MPALPFAVADDVRIEDLMNKGLRPVGVEGVGIRSQFLVRIEDLTNKGLRHSVVVRVAYPVTVRIEDLMNKGLRLEVL